MADDQDFQVIEYNTPAQAIDYRTINKYQFLDDSFEGTGGFSGNPDEISFIVHSRSETTRKWSERRQRAYYKNMMHPFITAQYQPVFTEQPPKTTVLDSAGKPYEVDTIYSEWVKNVDGAGLNKNQFNANACQSSYLKAVAYAVMDKADDMDEPIVYLQGAETVDQSMLIVDRFGRLQQIAFIVVDIPKNSDGKTVYRRTIWTNKDVTVQTTTDDAGKDRDWVTVNQQPLQIDSMPIHPVFSQQRTDPHNYLPYPSSSYKIASINTTLYNVTSERIWHIVQQALARLVTNADVESVKDGYSTAVKLTSLTSTNPTMGYINADTGIAPNHKELENDITNDIINLMAEAGVIVTRMESATEESGRAKAFTFRGMNTKLNNTVAMCVRLDEWMQNTYKKYNDPTGRWTSVTTYKTDYSIQDPTTITDLREVVYVFKELGLIDSVKETVKAIVRQYVTNTESYKIVEAEIDDMVIEDSGVLD